jgi:dipeptidase D
MRDNRAFPFRQAKMDLTQIEPRAVWRHFQTFLDTPRPSRHEAAVRARIRAWAESQKLAIFEDPTGNLILRKPASAGYEDRPVVTLQAHLDMVCQKNTGTIHDFLIDPIRAELRDGWLVAPDTTLGADNGIGASLALAALEAQDIAHPPLEVLLTVDEESGMSGAHGLATDVLTGELMLNLDTEDWGEYYLGCAGGSDVNVDWTYAEKTLPADCTLHRIELGGLRGGHSGVDIHLERGNAIKLMVRLLNSLSTRFGKAMQLVSLEGGTARNAIAREAVAVIGLPSELSATAAARVADFEATLKAEFTGVDDGLRLRMTALAQKTNGVHAIAAPDQHRLLAALHAAPHGVRRMSQRVPGVVETSNNFGVLRVADGHMHATLMVRSLIDSGVQALCAEIESLFALAGAQVGIEGGYPGWAPNPDSALLALAQDVHERLFGKRAAVKVIHAGLECGILSAKYPQLDILSFGPDIRGAHAPGERVNIESVAQTWELLKAILAAIPVKS